MYSKHSSLLQLLFFLLQMFAPDNTFQCEKEANKNMRKFMVNMMNIGVRWLIDLVIVLPDMTFTHPYTHTHKQIQTLNLCDVWIVLFTWFALHNLQIDYYWYISFNAHCPYKTDRKIFSTCYNSHSGMKGWITENNTTNIEKIRTCLWFLCNIFVAVD